MESSEGIHEIIARIKASIDHPNEADSERLRHYLDEYPQAIRALNKYNVSVGQGNHIHIGDSIHYGWSNDAIKALVHEILKAKETEASRVFRGLARKPLEKLEVDAALVERINATLQSIKNLDDDEHLSEDQKGTFDILKEEVRSLNNTRQTLTDIANSAQLLLEGAKRSLKAKIESLIGEGYQLVDSPISDSIECMSQYLKILEQLKMDLEEGREAADWLNENRKRLAKQFGRKALCSFPKIQANASDEEVSFFCFTLNQFLEQIAHCLQWGRYNILNSPDIPLVFDSKVYIKALEIIQKDVPPHLTEEARQQVQDCINYLIERLPSLPR
jgi:hypothetical protein